MFGGNRRDSLFSDFFFQLISDQIHRFNPVARAELSHFIWPARCFAYNKDFQVGICEPEIDYDVNVQGYLFLEGQIARKDRK